MATGSCRRVGLMKERIFGACWLLDIDSVVPTNDSALSVAYRAKNGVETK